MTQNEKIEMLKQTIVQLYEKEGRPKSYIADLLQLDRKTLVAKINEWELIKADERHLTPSNEKFLNKNRKTIIDMLDSDFSVAQIAEKINISRHSLLKTFIYNDKELLHHYNMYTKRREQKTETRKNKAMEQSSRQYISDGDNLEGEEWKDILGYSEYQVSNMGRVRSYAKRYQRYYLLKPVTNKESGRVYVALVSDNGTTKNLSLARLVAHAFVEGFSEVNNTVEHSDNDVTNNKAANLQWVSQKRNNELAYEKGKPGHAAFTKVRKFKKIVLDNKYEFKTFVSLAKFLNISETQLRRYMDGKTKTDHTFEIVY